MLLSLLSISRNVASSVRLSLFLFGFIPRKAITFVLLGGRRKHGHVVVYLRETKLLRILFMQDQNLQSLTEEEATGSLHFVPRNNISEIYYVTGRFQFTKNFRKFQWKFPSDEKRVPFNSGPFVAQ